MLLSQRCLEVPRMCATHLSVRENRAVRHGDGICTMLAAEESVKVMNVQYIQMYDRRYVRLCWRL